MNPRTDIDVQTVISEYVEGKSASQLARDFDCSIWSIINRLKKAGVIIRTKTQNEVRIPNLTEHKKRLLTEIVDGLMLGDGSMDRKGFLRLEQTITHQGWVQQLQRELLSLGVDAKISNQKARTSGKKIEGRIINCSPSVLLYTRSYKFMKEQRQRWYPDGVKILPRDLVLTPVVLAHWFCGDGSYDKTGALSIYTNNFTYDEVCRLAVLLKLSLGIYSTIYEQRPGQWTLRISRKADALKVRDLVWPHIPECFQYKFQYVRESRRYANNKLTDDQVREIRKLRSESLLSYEKIAAQFSVGWTGVQKICTGETYKHIR